MHSPCHCTAQVVFAPSGAPLVSAAAAACTLKFFFLIDHVGLAARLAPYTCKYTYVCVYAHIHPSVKRVLDTSIMTRKV